MTAPNKPKFIIKPLGITQDTRLSYAEQDYICLIWQLQNAKGCTASNRFFSDYFKVTRPRASEVISSLQKKGIIQTIETRNGKKITGRTILITDIDIKETLTGVSKKSLTGGIKESPVGGIKDLPEDKIKYKNTLFESFWEAYPKKINKPNALKAFLKVNPDEALLAAMLAAIATQKASEQWQRDDGRFIPYPATWLNGRRWEDETNTTTGGYVPNDPTESEADELLQKAGIL